MINSGIETPKISPKLVEKESVSPLAFTLEEMMGYP
jgi:hypothetical protein